MCFLEFSLLVGLRPSHMALVEKNPPANAGDIRDAVFNLCVRKIPKRRAW